MSRGLDGVALFADDVDRERFVAALGSLLAQSKCLCYAWCLMPNHFHLVLRPTEVALDTMMRRLNGTYARQFNMRHARRGYLFQDRYKSIVTEGFAYVRELIRYVHLNPLRAGMAKSLTDLENFRWSGHRTLLGIDTTPWMSAKEALSRFSPSLSRARQVYRSFLTEGIDRGGTFESIWAEIRACASEPDGDSRFGDGRVVGEPAFVRKAIERKEAEEARLRRLREERPDLPTLLKRVQTDHSFADSADLIRGRRPGCRAARSEFCHAAYKAYGYSLSQIGAFMGIQPASVHSLASRMRCTATESAVGTIPINNTPSPSTDVACAEAQ